jgi:hypothetical protein
LAIGIEFLGSEYDSMTASAHNVLAAFDALDPKEQQQVAVEILRRSVPRDDLTDGAFDDLAAEVFRTYDAEESNGAER